jgi:hypothetical protein
MYFPMKKLLLIAALVALATSAHAWDENDPGPEPKMLFPEAVAEPTKCPMEMELAEQTLLVHVPDCHDKDGNVIIGAEDHSFKIPSRKEDDCHPFIEAVEQVDQSTYLVRTLCKGYKPERATLIYQLIDDGDGGTLRITNAENS